MTPRVHDASAESLAKFLDWVSQSGAMKAATASALKAASNKVLAVLSDKERRDLSKVDLVETFEKFERESAQGLNADSLKTYRKRTRKAIEEFLAYRRDPENWRPSIPQRSRLSKSANGHPAPVVQTKVSRQASLPLTFPDEEFLSFNFPLRPQVTLKIMGVPRDLKTAEAKRLATFLMTLCEDYEETG